jgi:FMN phosphatase YigB (HAD superfamily)/cytidylate kinase
MYHSSNYDENAIQEGYIKDEPDLYWKRKEFNEGKINLCFITGLSGSGKSTMGADMAGKPNVDHCDMDNVVFNCNFDDKELSELGEMINAFFKGPGRQYRLKKGDLQSVTNNHRTKISNALVDFAIKYAASHKNTKFIVEGVYLFWMVSPEKLKDCAVYIKGTSSIKSAIRAAKRDGGMQDNTKDKVIVFSKTLVKKFYGMTYNTGNIDRWRRYYQTLQDKEEKSMKEAYIFNKKDIYYNRNKFNNGETNLCFITGQSGSGKSTMGKHMQGRCEVYDLDDVIWNKESFTMDNFKEYGELIYTFFNGKGKKYYLTAAELKGETQVQDGIPKPKNNWDYEHDLINDFVNYAISWAKSHKDIKYVLEGIWIYMYIEPSKLKDYAVYIKGTSMLTSIYRASKRDNRFKSNILHPGMWIDGEKGLKKYRDYFEPRSEESIHEVKRSDLPDSAFGIPEDRKFPLDTEQHVKSAIHLFGHAEESKKKSLAKRINSAAKKYDIRIPETTQVYKYLNESVNEIIPDGIENIIFDMGRVLIDANTLDALYDNPNIPDEYCEEIRDFINEKLFYGSDIEYKRKIQGYDLEQIRDYLAKALPEHLSPYMDDILDTLKPAMFIYSYVPEMLDLLRSMGYKLYYLSNWDRYSYDLEKEFFDPLLEQFDGGLFSFELGEILKPDREMYEALCEKYHIFANKSIFFDDMEENIEAARSVGMAAYKFDKDITPKILFGTCVRIPDNSDDLILIANGDDGFTKRHISEFGWWYLDETRTPSGIDEEYYYKTLDDAIKYKVDKLISQDAFTDDSPNVLEYVYTNAKAFCEDKTPPEAVCVGQILLYESGGYEWVVQYPLKMENRILCGLKEFSMASVNPVIGINKPFLIKIGDQNHPELLPTDHFVYSQDIESDKVLTVDSDNHLKVKKVKDLDIIEAYEFVGDMAYIHRLNKLYKENAEVSNLYTLLTNKPMLTEDQIDFDPSFKRIDFDLLKQKELAEMVTLRDNLMEAMNYNPLRLPVLESAIIKKPSFLSKYNTAGDISIKEDFDGVYFYSDITKKRSASAASTLQLTENMLRAIL